MRSILFSLFVALLPLVSLALDVSGDILDADFDNWLETVAKEWALKGLAVAVVRQGSDASQWHVETKGYGVKDLKGTPVTADTLFNIGSNTKLFTVLSLGQLIANSNGTLDWTTKVASLLPQEWKLQDPIASQNAKIRDLLSHRTGLPRHDLSTGRYDTIAQLVSKLRYLRPSAEFREVWQYSNLMYSTVSLIVERVSATKFQKFVHDHLLVPLGMNSTTMYFSDPFVNATISDTFALVARNVSDGEGWLKSRYESVPYTFDGTGDDVVGAGGVISSAVDIATWLQTLLLNGRHPKTNVSVIPEAAVLEAAQGVTVENPRAPYPELSPYVYGAGQSVYSYQGHEVIEHSGGVIGFQSVIARFPSDGLGIAVLTNWDDGFSIVDTIKYRIAEKALGLPEQPDWDGRARASVSAILEAQSAAPPYNPAAPRPDVDVAHLAGNYTNGGYGTFELCAGSAPLPTSPSIKCAALLRTANLTLPGVINPSIPNLIAAVDKIGFSHLYFEHISHNQFVINMLDAVPAKSYGANFVYQRNPVGITEFVVVGGKVTGMAFGGGVWGAGTGVDEPTGNTVQERAEVWFDRV